MHRAKKLTSVFILVLCYLLSLASPGEACSTGSEESADPKLLIARAEVIVRAVAVKLRTEFLLLEKAKAVRAALALC